MLDYESRIEQLTETLTFQQRDAEEKIESNRKATLQTQMEALHQALHAFKLKRAVEDRYQTNHNSVYPKIKKLKS